MTRYRRRVLDYEMLTQCKEVMKTACASLAAELEEFYGEPDHVRVLVSYPPTLAISTLTVRLKGSAARRLTQDFGDRIDRARMDGRLWNPSFLAASTGETPLASVRPYLEQQNRLG